MGPGQSQGSAVHDGLRCVKTRCHTDSVAGMFLFLDLKRNCRTRDVALDMLMRVLADVVLPQRNILPSSLYMVERVLQSRPPDSFCYPACPNDDYVWPHLERSRWSDHTDNHCPECGSSRF
ncbi:hypothetical protein WJX77_005412 [Trebouxia sp. C0004]